MNSLHLLNVTTLPGEYGANLMSVWRLCVLVIQFRLSLFSSILYLCESLYHEKLCQYTETVNFFIQFFFLNCSMQTNIVILLPALILLLFWIVLYCKFHSDLMLISDSISHDCTLTWNLVMDVSNSTRTCSHTYGLWLWLRGLDYKWAFELPTRSQLQKSSH